MDSPFHPKQRVMDAQFLPNAPPTLSTSQAHSSVSFATSSQSLASTIRCLSGISKHMRDRQKERGISDALVMEVMADGLITDQRDSRSLHVSDHIIVVSQLGSRSREGITTFRHPLLGEWRAVNSSHDSMVNRMETAYFFFQDCEYCFYGGIADKIEGRVELGFGIQVLKDSQSDSFFDMVSVISSPAEPTIVRMCRMKLEKVLSRSSAAASGVLGRDSISSNMSTAARSNASTKHAGPVRYIDAVVEGENHKIPILRYLRVDSTAEEKRSVHSWFEYDVLETAETRPSFTFKELQASLAACCFSLPQLSGRWRLEEVGDYPGFSAYSIVAIPMHYGAGTSSESDQVQCMVLALQSNDEEEWKYEHLFVGHGTIATIGGECRISATLRRTRLDCFRRYSCCTFETLQGTPDRLRLSSGSDLVRMAPARSPADAAATPSAAHAAETVMVGSEVQRLLRQFVPDQLNFGTAVQAGDARRVAELMSAAESRPDLSSPIQIESRLGRMAVPLVAAALKGVTEVVDVLLEYQLPSLNKDPWTLACAAVCSVRAEASLLAQLAANPSLREAVCPRNHHLAMLGMEGCSLVEVAVLAKGAALARKLVAECGCSHTLATAVQSSDVLWLRRNTRSWAGVVNRHFRKGGATALVASFTPLIAAAAASDAAVVECLLEHRADPFVCRHGRTSTAINYAQVYDQNVSSKFPVLRALLREAARLREEGKLPSKWVDVSGCCEEWRLATHPAAWELIEDFELEDCSGPCDEDQGNSDREGEVELGNASGVWDQPNTNNLTQDGLAHLTL